jgi:hypothetical protein
MRFLGTVDIVAIHSPTSIMKMERSTQLLDLSVGFIL